MEGSNETRKAAGIGKQVYCVKIKSTLDGVFL